MRLIKFFLLLTNLFFVACSGKYEQHYDTFDDFSKANQRNKGWFPDFISSDAYDLKNNSYLDPLCAFGTFNFSNDNYYDSIFTNPITEKIDFSAFKEKVTAHEGRRPGWFLEPDINPKDNFETIKVNRFYITRDKGQKKIYFVLSN